jgi:hypothetical protein
MCAKPHSLRLHTAAVVLLCTACDGIQSLGPEVEPNPWTNGPIAQLEWTVGQWSWLHTSEPGSSSQEEVVSETPESLGYGVILEIRRDGSLIVAREGVAPVAHAFRTRRERLRGFGLQGWGEGVDVDWIRFEPALRIGGTEAELYSVEKKPGDQLTLLSWTSGSRLWFERLQP